MMSWLLAPNRSASVRLPVGASKTYCFSTLTQGSARRSALTRSRIRVSAFSFFRCALRAASHSSRETTLCDCMLDLLLDRADAGIRRLGLSVYQAAPTRLAPSADTARATPAVR